MEIAIVVIPGFTALDAVGPYEVLCRLPGAKVTIVGIDRGQCPDGRGALVLSPSVGIDDMSRADLLPRAWRPRS